ncbi:LIM zinc-binding domain-containing [Takifugu flavidus]|uniref:LIM zinc-binding domain-containing n=1 Tax=Takifugu flavidus TaxID=433684 RepID=A0A5C6P4U2_9TELE|nr:LIM zinc-binding domain-containing [Takifugu flavidus]
MNPQCARCGKIVYPTEKVSCLDTVSWMTRRSVLLVRFCEDDRNGNLWAGPVKLDTMDEDRAESTVPSCVSLKSDRSKYKGIDFRSSEEMATISSDGKKAPKQLREKP